MSNTLSGGMLRYVRLATQHPDPRWYFALDLAQRRDHSALVALQLQWTGHGRCPLTFANLFQPTLHLRHLERFAQGTSYEKLYNLVGERIESFRTFNTDIHRELIVDASGPGPVIIDRLRLNLKRGLIVTPAIITGGQTVNRLKGGYIGVPRRTLVTHVQLVLAAKTLKCEPTLPGLDILTEELLELSGGDTQPASSSAHDDLAIATALGVWAAARRTPELLPESDDNESNGRYTGHRGPHFQ